MLEIKQFPPDPSAFDVDRNDVRKCFFSGLFEESVEVNGKQRVLYTYLPEALHYNQPCIALAIPDGVEITHYLEYSSWKEFADQQQVFMFIATPKDGKWNFDPEDCDYINQVFLKMYARKYYVTIQDNCYLFGVGEGATAAQMAAMKISSNWAGLATFGDLQKEVLGDVGAVAEFKAGNDNMELFISAEKTQLPVWMCWSKNSGVNALVCDYWKKANDSSEECLSSKDADEIYLPRPVMKASQVNEEKIAQVRITDHLEGEPTLEQLNAVWKFLFQAYRHRGFGIKQLRYKIDPKDYGFTFHTIECDGWTRCWYEYVPEKVKKSGEPAPVVITMHGRGSTGEAFISLSGMSRVAEERDFIAIFPEACVYQMRPGSLRNLLLWNGKYNGQPIDDVKFLLAMLDDIKSRNSVDSSRIYACGQSSGGMMSNTLAEKASKVFTAVAPWSALINPSEGFTLPTAIEPQIPYLFLFGDSDILSSDMKNGPIPTRVNADIAKVLDNLIKIYGLSTTPVSYKVGEITYFIYKNKKGTPMLTVGRVHNMPHANYPRESWISYDEFMSKFSRRADGTLLYMGEEAI